MEKMNRSEEKELGKRADSDLHCRISILIPPTFIQRNCVHFPMAVTNLKGDQ